MFPTLYKVDTKGKLREWTINVEDDKYWSVQGLIDGKKITNKPMVAKPKNVGRSNSTTAEDQAITEANAKFDKQLDKGYFIDIEQAKKQELPFYKPMLADKYEDRKDILEYPVYCQPKLDGIRCIVRLENGKLVGRSRNGKVIDCIEHILKGLEAMFEKNSSLIVDGELYNHQLKDNFNKITSLVRKQKPIRRDSDTDKSFVKKLAKYEEAIKESKELVQYWIYDAPRVGEFMEDASFSDRFNYFEYNLFPYGDWKCEILVPTQICYSETQLDDMYAEYVMDGYEGQIIRNNKEYQNKRTKHLLKRKDFLDSEYLILDIQEGEGNRVGTAKNLICLCPQTGNKFHSNIKGSHEYLADILNDKESYIGKLATIQYQELTPDGIPRFPFAIAFRDYE